MFNKSFPIILIFFIIIAFILLQPTMISYLPYPSRESKVNEFINEITDGGSIDSRQYWQKREQYFPGTFHFSKKGVDPKHFNIVLQNSSVSLAQQNLLVLAQYTSSFIISDEILIDTKTATTILSKIKKRQGGINVVQKGENYIVIEGEDKKLYLLFVVSHDDMMRSNGFAAENKELSAGKSWLSVSEIILEK